MEDRFMIKNTFYFLLLLSTFVTHTAEPTSKTHRQALAPLCVAPNEQEPARISISEALVRATHTLMNDLQQVETDKQWPSFLTEVDALQTANTSLEQNQEELNPKRLFICRDTRTIDQEEAQAIISSAQITFAFLLENDKNMLKRMKHSQRIDWIEKQLEDIYAYIVKDFVKHSLKQRLQQNQCRSAQQKHISFVDQEHTL
jgi:hypothetical protein